MIISLVAVGVTLGLSILGGYAFAMFSFRGKDVLFLFTLGILMVPMLCSDLLYVLLNAVGLHNSLVGVALVLAPVPAAVRDPT